MSVETVLAILGDLGQNIKAFLQSPQVATLLVLIMADWLAGVAAAIRTKQFGWERVADFYQTNVIPKVLGYLAAWLVAEYAVEEFLGEGAWFVADGIQWFFWGQLILSVLGSILANLKEAGMELPEE